MSGINNLTNSSIVWKKIKSIRGTNRNTINLLTDSNLSTSPKEVANTLGEMFQDNSSNSNYDPVFLSNAYIYTTTQRTMSPVTMFKPILTPLYSLKNWRTLFETAKAKAPVRTESPTYSYNIYQRTQGSIYYLYTIQYGTTIDSPIHGGMVMSFLF